MTTPDVHRGSLTDAYKDGYTHALTTTVPLVPRWASSQYAFLYNNGWMDGKASLTPSSLTIPTTI